MKGVYKSDEVHGEIKMSKYKITLIIWLKYDESYSILLKFKFMWF